MRRVLIVLLVAVYSFSATSQEKIPETVLSNDQETEFYYFYIEALRVKMLGDISQSYQIFNRCLAIDPNSSAVNSELGKILIQAGDIDKAIEHIEKAASIDPDDLEYRRILIDLYVNRKDLDSAITHLEYIIKEDSKDVTSRLYLASLYKDQGDLNKAYVIIYDILRKDPTNITAIGSKAEIFAAKGDDKRALKCYEDIKSIDPEYSFVYASIANHYLMKGEAKKAYSSVIEAIERENLSVDTKRMLIYSITADSTYTKEQVEGAIDLLCEVDSTDSAVYQIKGLYLAGEGDFVESRPLLKKAISIEPNIYNYHETLIQIDLQIGDMDSLEVDSRACRLMFPQAPLPYIYESVALSIRKEYDQLLEVASKGAELSVVPKEKAQMVSFVADAYYGLGMIDSSFVYFDKALELDPENLTILNNYAYILACEDRDLNKAEAMITPVISAQSDNYTFLDTYAWVLYKKKDYLLAKFYMEKVIEFSKEESYDIYDHYGDILFASDSVEDAIESWKKAIELGGDEEEIGKKIENAEATN